MLHFLFYGGGGLYKKKKDIIQHNCVHKCRVLNMDNYLSIFKKKKLSIFIRLKMRFRLDVKFKEVWDS